MAKPGTGSQKKPAAKRPAKPTGSTATQRSKSAPRPKPAAPRPRPAAPPRPMMPRWLKYTLAGLILFTLTLRTGPLVPLLVCAFALGLGVWQLTQHRARMWWTGALFVSVGLYTLGMFLVRWYAPFWYFYFAAWIFVIVAVVAEGGRSMEQRKAQRTG